MARSCFYVVTDDQMVAMRAKQLAESCGADAKVFSHVEWTQKYGGGGGTVAVNGVPALSTGVGLMTPSPSEGGGKVLPFPGPQAVSASSVETINDMESRAIENAIHMYKGNLTEAAKALGIGRATLYRKVKQYNIDPQSARRKRVA